MKREYFSMLFMVGFVGLFFLASYVFGQEAVRENLSAFIVVWIMIAFYAGQYSMRFPKSF